MQQTNRNLYDSDSADRSNRYAPQTAQGNFHFLFDTLCGRDDEGLVLHAQRGVKEDESSDWCKKRVVEEGSTKIGENQQWPTFSRLTKSSHNQPT